jgi:hypothetical protein
MLPWPALGLTVPYRVFRSPMSNNTVVKSAVRTLQLPAATVIDLDASGVDTAAQTFSAFGSDVAILFAPNGAIERVYVYGDPNSPYYVTNPIFLLVGKRQRMPLQPVTASSATWPLNADQATWPNWADLTNIWLVINPQTGLVSTGENATVLDANGAPVDMTSATWINPTGWPTYISATRRLARDLQGMGGK